MPNFFLSFIQKSIGQFKACSVQQEYPQKNKILQKGTGIKYFGSF